MSSLNLDNPDYLEQVRHFRNIKLSSSDWTQIPDNSLTEEERNNWKEYRQKLRDFPSNITDPKAVYDEEIANIFNQSGYKLWPNTPK